MKSLPKNIETHLEHLDQQPVNFDTTQPINSAEWHTYDTRILLGVDTSNNAMWDKACQAVAEYKFPPPEVMRVYFDESVPLAERVLSLNSKFMGLGFAWGGRIERVIDERRETEAGEIQIWGCNYQTVVGHFEQGELTTEIWKYAESREIYFRMHAYSRIDTIPNLIFRLSFPLILPLMRPYFVWRSKQRMKKLVNS